MAASEPEEGFKVIDRRRQPGEAVPPAAAPEPAVPPRSAAGPGSDIGTPAPPAEPGRSLAGLFVMLAGSAAMAMGEVADPVTGQRHMDLDQAADIIDLLLLLREKTEGHRTAEETQVLDELLYDLQLRFVSVRKRSG